MILTLDDDALSQVWARYPKTSLGNYDLLAGFGATVDGKRAALATDAARLADLIGIRHPYLSRFIERCVDEAEIE